MPGEGELQLYEEQGFLGSLWNGLKYITAPLAFAAGLFLSSPAQAEEAKPHPEPEITLSGLKKRPEFTQTFDILSEDRKTGACDVEIDGRRYVAYPLSRRNFEPDALDAVELSKQLSQKRPWLITYNGEVVQDSEIYYQAALVANYTRMFNHERFAQSLEEEAERYRSVLSKSKTPRTALKVAKPTTEILSGLLFPSVEGKANIARMAQTRITRAIQKEILGELISEASKVLIKKPDMSTDGAFNSAMCQIISQSADELDNASETLLRMKYPFRYRDIEKLSEQIIDARSDAHAALVGLACYYGAGDPANRWSHPEFRPFFNFIVEQVGKPIVKGALGSEVDSVIVSPIINRVVQIHSDAQRAYFQEAANAEELNEWVYGRRNVIPGSHKILREIFKIYGDSKVTKIPRSSISKVRREGRKQRISINGGILDLNLEENCEWEVYKILIGNVDTDMERETVITLNPIKPYTKESKPYLIVARRNGNKYEIKDVRKLYGKFISSHMFHEESKNDFVFIDIDYDGMKEVVVSTDYNTDGTFLISVLRFYENGNERWSPSYPNLFSYFGIGPPKYMKAFVSFVNIDGKGNLEFIYDGNGACIANPESCTYYYDKDDMWRLAGEYLKRRGLKSRFFNSK